MAKSSPIFLIVLLCSLATSAAFAQQNSGASISPEEVRKRQLAERQHHENMVRMQAEHQQRMLQAAENARRNAAQNQQPAQQAAPNSNLRTPTAPTAAAPTAAAPTAAAPTAAAPTAAAPTEFRAAWVQVKNGQVPANMLRGGDFKGAPLAICRTQMPDGLHPGKVWSGQCYIGYFGKETSSPNFEVLVIK